MDEVVDLYETALIRWADEQARALRAAAASRVNLPIDWENVAEEIESLGKSQRSELRSRLATIVEHLLKLAYSPAQDPRDGWRDTVRRERRDVGAVLDDNSSLRREVAGLIDWASLHSGRLVHDNLSDHHEVDRAAATEIAGRRFTEEQVLGNWFPEPQDGR